MPLPAYAVLLAGGHGTRFWPLSRRARPKQFLPLAGPDSLLQQTYRRIARVFPPGRIFVVGAVEHRRLLRQQLPRLPRGRLLLEPVGRNTAAAIALAAEHVRAALPAGQADALLAVFPADHVIRNQAAFRRIARAALQAATEEGAMVVLGIPPAYPHTGYGYVERGQRLGRAGREPVYRVRRFTEKPGRQTAARYLRSRRYSWNSGMFFWRLSTLDGLLRRHLPHTQRALRALAPAIGRGNYAGRLKRAYPRLKSISIDYAIAEPAAARGHGRLIPADIGWSDLGSWSAAYEWRARTPGENVVPEPHLLRDARGNWLSAPGKFVAAIGVNDLVVVDTPDALLVCARERAQEVRKVVDSLKKRKRKRLL